MVKSKIRLYPANQNFFSRRKNKTSKKSSTPWELRRKSNIIMSLRKMNNYWIKEITKWKIKKLRIIKKIKLII